MIEACFNQSNMNTDTAIQKAGSVKALADVLGVSVQAVYLWQRRGRLPDLRVYQLKERRPEWTEAPLLERAP